MSRLKKKLKMANLKKYLSVFMAFVMLVAAAGVITIVEARADSYDKKADIPTVVEFNDKYYTKDNPYVILEIVPDKCIGQLGYWVGGDSMPVKESDLKKLYEKTGNNASVKSTMEKELSHGVAQIFSGQNWDGAHGTYISDEYGNLRYFEDRNVLAHMLFSDNDDTDMATKYSDMSDKLVVKTVKDTELTYDDVKNADFVYMNPKLHDGSVANAYKKMAEYCATYGLGKATGLSQDYVWNNTTETTLHIRNDLALYIYMRNVNDNLAVSMDWSALGSDTTNGFYQLGILELAITQEQFIEEYALEDMINNEAENRAGVFQYKGSGGSVETTATSMTVKRLDGTVVPWGLEMFWQILHPGSGQPPQYPYFNATSTANGSEYIHNNFYTFPGTNVMDQSMKNGISGGDVARPGSDLATVQDIFGVSTPMWGGTPNATYRDILRYIMGLYSLNDYMSEINVIEIQPWGRYEFNSAEGADKILRTFGITGDYTVVSQSLEEGTDKGTYVLNKKSRDFTVNIRSVSVNAFNGLNEDLKSSVDLIIIGTYNPSSYINTNYKNNTANTGTLITESGAIVSNSNIGSKNYSGNDFTNKAYERLYEYVKAGLPLLEMPDVYNASGVIDRVKRDGSESNIYKMSRLKLNERLNAEGKASSNITTLADDSTSTDFKTKKVLEFPARPDFTIVSPSAYDYDSNRTPLALGDVSFQIRADGNIPAGSHVKLYIDRNADALYNEVASGDMRELFADYDIPTTVTAGSTYTINIDGSLPSKWFGYFKFKVEISRAGYSQIEESSFALKAQESKTVKVLHIYNAKDDKSYDESTTLSMTSDTFKSSFQTASAVTGMKLDVTTMKIQEFEDKIKNDANYLSTFSIVVLGFRDAYGRVERPFRSQEAIDALGKYIDEGYSVLFTHDTMTYKDEADTYNEPLMTKQLTEPIGMKGSGAYTNSLLSKLSKYTAFNDVGGSTSTKNTNEVNKLNWGQVTEYPYKIGDTIEVATTHGQFYQLNLEEIKTTDAEGNELAGVHDSEVTVWYTLGEGNLGNAKYFENCGQDAVNNYYIYSKGNVTYTSAGHSKIESNDQEMKLFVNTLVRSIIVATMPPEVKIINGVSTGDNNYDIIARTLKTDINGVVSTDNTIPLIFTATDEDLAAGDKFAKAKIFVDENYNGAYDDGELVLRDYGDTLENQKEYTEDLYALANAQGAAALSKVLGLYTTNKLKIGIQVTDTAKASGIAFGTYVRRNYFELD